MAEPFIDAGRLRVSGTIKAQFTDGTDMLARLLGLTDPPRHHVKVYCPDGADRHCPVCHEPAESITLEDVALVSGGPAPRMGDGTGYWLVGLDPAAYACEPCGHRFDRDGKEIRAQDA